MKKPIPPQPSRSRIAAIKKALPNGSIMRIARQITGQDNPLHGLVSRTLNGRVSPNRWDSRHDAIIEAAEGELAKAGITLTAQKKGDPKAAPSKPSPMKGG